MMLARFSIRAQLRTAFGVLVFGIAAIGGVGLRQMTAIAGRAQEIQPPPGLTRQADTLRQHVDGFLAGIRAA